jgi:hypothetical protein
MAIIPPRRRGVSCAPISTDLPEREPAPTESGAHGLAEGPYPGLDVERRDTISLPSREWLSAAPRPESRRTAP